MKRMCALAAVLSLVAPGGALAWSGPQATIANKDGRRVIQICDQGGGCQTSTAFEMSIRNINWPPALYQAQLALTYLSPAANGVVPIVHMVLNGVDDAKVKDAADHLNTLNSRPYVYLRLRADAPAGAFEAMQLQNLQGQAVNDTNDQLSPFS